MDAQLWWEPSGAPSVLHGVTTVVIGSCGFGIAPFTAGNSEYVLRSLESVEEIPYRVTRDALPMSWTGWADYYEQLGALALGVNVAGFVPHSALRVGVLGDAGRNERLDDAQVDRLRAELREALGAGAVGFSTSRGGNHTDANGDPVPSRRGERRRAALVDRRVRGSHLADQHRGQGRHLRRRGAARDGGARVLQRLGAAHGHPRHVDAAGGRAGRHARVAPPGGVLGRTVSTAAAPGLRAGGAERHPLPGGVVRRDDRRLGARLLGLRRPRRRRARVDRVASPEFREILRDAPEDCDRITAPCFDRWTIGASPTRRDAVGLTVTEFARAEGVHPVDAILDLALADGLRTVIEAPLSNLDAGAVRELITAPTTLIGLGDAGAHITSISNYTYPTFVLGELAGRRGWMPVTDAVRRMTSQPASTMGLRDRGTLTPGARADVNVIDLERLAVGVAELVDDLPGGGQRLHCDATGYDAVIVNGVVTVEGDRLTGGRAGELARAACERRRGGRGPAHRDREDPRPGVGAAFGAAGRDGRVRDRPRRADRHAVPFVQRMAASGADRGPEPGRGDPRPRGAGTVGGRRQRGHRGARVRRAVRHRLLRRRRRPRHLPPGDRRARARPARRDDGVRRLAHLRGRRLRHRGAAGSARRRSCRCCAPAARGWWCPRRCA